MITSTIRECLLRAITYHIISSVHLDREPIAGVLVEIAIRCHAEVRLGKWLCAKDLGRGPIILCRAGF